MSSEIDRSIKCDCWCKLDYCPVGCNEDLSTPEKCKNLDVNFEEIKI